MAHAVSAFSDRSERVPWVAVALALLLHGGVAGALWWINRLPSKPPVEDVIQVSFEEPPKPPAPEPQKAPEKAPEKVPEPPKPAPPLPPVEALSPPADIVADKPTQAPPKGDRPKDALLAPPPPPLRDTEQVRDPPSQPAQQTPQQTAMARPEPVTPPLPSPVTPPVSAPVPSPVPPPRPALAPAAPSGALPRPPEMPPLPAPKPTPAPTLPPPAQEKQAAAAPAPVTPKPPAPPVPQLQAPKVAPSPLSTLPSNRPPAGTQSDNPSPSPFVNPADTYSRARVADNYLWQVVRRLQGYRYTANVNARQGLTVVRIVVARDGRLLDVTVTRSSGYPEFDNGVLAGVRAGSPYAPLPPEIKGDSASFDLPLVSVNRGG